MGYLEKLSGVAKKLSGKEGVFHLHVYHDSWCKSSKTGVPQDCDCNPDLRVEKEEDNVDS